MAKGTEHGILRKVTTPARGPAGETSQGDVGRRQTCTMEVRCEMGDVRKAGRTAGLLPPLAYRCNEVFFRRKSMRMNCPNVIVFVK